MAVHGLRLVAVLCLSLQPAAAILQRAARGHANPADSQTIDGPDCGQVKKIFPQWEKAKQVGQVAGKGHGTISNSNAVVGRLRAASARVREAGNALGESGTPHPAITAAADKADQVATEVEGKVSALEAKLGPFTNAIGSSDMSGASVTDEQVLEVKDLTSALELSTRGAQDEVQRLLKKADEVQAEAMKSSETQARLIASVLSSVTPLLKESPDVAQKAGWAVNEAKAAITAADAVAAKIDPTTAGDQQPVVEAAKSGLETKKQAVAEAHPLVTAAIADVNTVTQTLTEKTKTLKETQQSIAGGGVVSASVVTPQLTAAEDAESAVRIALGTLRDAGATMMDRKERLEAATAELAKDVPVGPQ